MSATDNNDQAMLDTLTPEERAAISEVDAEEQAALERIASGAAPSADDNDDDGDDAAAAGSAAPAAASQAADGAAAQPATAPAAPAVADDAATQGKPVTYKADLPADFADKKADVERRSAELREKFKAGEIELDDYEAQQEQIRQERDGLRTLELKAEISKEMNQQTIEQQWHAAIDRQIAAAAKPEHGGIDYRTDTEKMNDLDGFVRQLGARAENADKSMDWFLQEAHRRVLALHGISTQKPPASAPAADPVKDAVSRRTPPVAAVAPSVAHVPGSDGPGDIAGDEFADLDRLEGVELEAALARLSPAQREKYAAGV